MVAKFLTSAVLALATTQMVSAQTFTSCDPTKKKCPADPAFGDEKVTVDFTQGLGEYFKEADGTTIEHDERGAIFTIEKETNAPTVFTEKTIFFGHIDVEVVASDGVGVVTSFVLQSADLDEVDWEWLGGDTTQVQTNYFGKGDTTTYDRGTYEQVDAPQSKVHKYSIDWTKDHVQWFIDDNMVRELKYADAQGGSRFPQTPCQIKLGTWVAGGKDSPKGTVEWAGGYTDFSQGPFHAYYKSVTIQDYSNGVKGAKEYVWKDGSDGSYQSINVVTGDGSSDDEPSSTSTSASATKTTPTPTPSGSATKTSSGSETSSTASSASSSGASSSGVTTPTPSGSASTPSGAASSGSGEAPPTESDPVRVPDSGAFKTSFSAIALGAGLVAALMI